MSEWLETTLADTCASFFSTCKILSNSTSECWFTPRLRDVIKFSITCREDFSSSWWLINSTKDKSNCQHSRPHTHSQLLLLETSNSLTLHFSSTLHGKQHGILKIVESRMSQFLLHPPCAARGGTRVRTFHFSCISSFYPHVLHSVHAWCLLPNMFSPHRIKENNGGWVKDKHHSLLYKLISFNQRTVPEMVCQPPAALTKLQRHR